MHVSLPVTEKYSKFISTFLEKLDLQFDLYSETTIAKYLKYLSIQMQFLYCIVTYQKWVFTINPT